ncbi:Alpha/Beta hydrolase protein [Pestalotiopsis sp. NC0098]|nr:Alpha/Beta hydrolase protein [Pestalotiopsis sp. NC0098]
MIGFITRATVALGVVSAAAVNSPRAEVDCTGVNAININCKSSEASYHRDHFYVGGRSLNATTGTLTVDQLYVEKLTPTGDSLKPNPLVFTHGGGIAGSTWLNTPDGREGWASYFTRQGYVVYLVDSNSIGRSSENDLASFSMVAGTSNENVEIGFTAVELYNYYPQAALHTQWPGSGRNGDPVFDNFKKSFIPLTSSYAAQETAMRRSGCQLLSLLGASAYIISHSLGSRFPILMSNDCPQYIAASINIEAASVPFWSYGYGLGGSPSTPYGFTWTAVDYVPAITNSSELEIESVGEESLTKRNCYRQKEPARQLPNIASVPYLMVTSEASVHITYDHCIVDYLEQVGGSPDFIKLADIGIHGNSHFMHVEKNNLEIAAVVQDWIEKH